MIFLRNYVVEFLGASYDSLAGETTFTYRVTGQGVPPALSHFDLELIGCEFVEAAPGPIEVGTDPTTGIDGVKWDSGLETDESRIYTVVLSGEVGIGTVDTAVKSGPTFEAGPIAGPNCECGLPTPAPSPTPTPAVGDCEPGPQAALLRGFDIQFAGSEYMPDGNTTRFTYVVTGQEAPSELSHFDLELPGCEVAGADPVPYELGIDPTTGLDGIKWDHPLAEDASTTFTLLVSGNVPAGMVQAAVKAANGFDAGPIAGPECDCLVVTPAPSPATDATPSPSPAPSPTPGPAVVCVGLDSWRDSAKKKFANTALVMGTLDQGKEQLLGVRFTGLEIPPGSEIAHATIQFQAASANDEQTQLRIEGEAAENAAPFTSKPNDVQKRPRTSSNVSWNSPAWMAIGDAGPEQLTPDMAVLVQEIVDRPGWQAGNAIVFIFTGTGRRTAESYEGDIEGAPQLCIEYLPPIQ